LNCLKNAKSGIYCSPLRLLAFEIYQTLNSEDIKCSLVTGEEYRYIPESTHISSTIEMADINQIFDVAIIDEIQMISDLERGCAWTNALLGLVASEIHLCGDSSCVNLIKKICQTNGEELEIKEYKRLNELVFEDSSLRNNWKILKPRDCVIAFSRKDSKEILPFSFLSICNQIEY
jgi:ATP-dependent RNA helicase SUPV3L1/SUV3